MVGFTVGCVIVGEGYLPQLIVILLSLEDDLVIVANVEVFAVNSCPLII
jgi:hypothetical protein